MDAAYTVGYEYRTYTMTVDENGVAGYHTAPEVTTDAAEGAGYVGERIGLDARAMEGFAPLATNPGTVQVLSGGENHWDFVYERYIPLNPGAVVVNHHYKTVTVAVNGTASENTQSVYGAPVVKYIGEVYTAEAAPNGYELKEVTFNGAELAKPYTVALTAGRNEIVFVYELVQERDNENVTVIHEYYEKAADIENGQPEKVAEEVIPDIPEGSQFTAEQKVEKSYEFHSVEPNLTITVVEGGDNTIVIRYVRKEARYQVIHIYNRNNREEGRTSEIVKGLDGDVIDADGIAKVTEYNGRDYKFVSVTGDITLDADRMKTIVLEYNRKSGGKTPVIPGPDEPTPDEPVIDIPDEPTPLAPTPGGEVEIPDEEVPLANVPKTGDESLRHILMALGLAGLAYTGKKREEEEI